MTTTTETTTRRPPPRRRGGRWIDDWDPDDEQFWEATGKRIARKNLFFSIFAEHLGFAIWVLWSVVVINLANAGLPMTLSEMFWLTAVPNLSAPRCASRTRSRCRGSAVACGR